MSRLKKFQRNLTASYIQLGALVVYSLAAVPLVLRWLPKEEFGLWSLLIQIMGYVSLIDLGMTQATCRLLVDHKDSPEDGKYGSLLKTFGLVCLAQALLVVLAFFILAPVLAALLELPARYSEMFVSLIRLQCLVVGFNFLIRPLSQILVANQRSDIMVYGEIFYLFASLAILAILLSKGVGIFSYFYAGLIVPAVAPLWLFWNCRRLALFPGRGRWGQTSRQMFKEIFNYGKDVFLVTLGWQLIMTSQIIVITRCLGLDMAAVWAVGIRFFTLIMQLVLRAFTVSMPTLAEMLARQESARLKKRFKELVLLITGMAVVLAFSFVLCNSVFIKVWLSGRILWPPVNDLLLAVWLIAIAMQTCHFNLIILRKEIAGLKYVLLAEGICFIAGAILIGSRWGIAGILGVSIICTGLFSYQYCLRQSRQYFACAGFWEIAFEWLRPVFRLMFWLGLIAGICWPLTRMIDDLWLRLFANALTAGVAGGILFVRIGCPAAIVHELAGFLPAPAKKVLLAVVPNHHGG